MRTRGAHGAWPCAVEAPWTERYWLQSESKHLSNLKGLAVMKRLTDRLAGGVTCTVFTSTSVMGWGAGGGTHAELCVKL